MTSTPENAAEAGASTSVDRAISADALPADLTPTRSPEGSRVGKWLDRVWKALLVGAAIVMPIGGVLTAVGQRGLSDNLVTGAFAVGLLAVPIGLLSVRVNRPPKIDGGAEEQSTDNPRREPSL